MAETETKTKGFLSKLWKTHGTMAKYIGAFGIPAVFGFFPKAATTANALNPEATLLDSFTILWGMMGTTITEFAVPGWSVLFSQIGDAATTAFNAVSNAAIFTPAVPAPLPGP